MESQTSDLEQELANDIADCEFDPLGFARYAYEWGEGELAASPGPRDWQAEVLRAIRGHLADEKTRYQPLQIAIASGHGIGKSALVGMVTHWALSCYVGARVLITANKAEQLTSKTQPEVARWIRRAINSHWFDVQATRIKARDPHFAESWRADFETWTEKNTEAFQGLHNLGRIIVVIFDESSAIPDTIWETTEGALTDEHTVILWLVLGNPTRNTGRFRECFGRHKHRWITFQIDSRTVEGTNKEQLNRWVADYGEDSDFVRVRVRGEFPRAGSTQFIAGDVVAACRAFNAPPQSALPKILAVDVARFGDDQTVIGYRHGRKFVVLEKMRGKDLVFVAERVIHWRAEEEPDAIVVDADGLGAGVVDHLKFRGFGNRLFEFHGGQRPHDTGQFYNRRAEVWAEMKAWLEAGADIPDDPELDMQLTAPEYGYASGKRATGTLFIESKDDMKARGLESPDIADALAMTFAVTVAPPKPKAAPAMLTLGQAHHGWMG
jgi:hypothetical protein